MRYACIAATIMVAFQFTSLASASVQGLREMVSTTAFSKGMAITAESGSLEDVYKNPAALSALSSTVMSSSYSSVFDNAYYTASFAYGTAINSDWSLAVSMPFRVVDGMSETVNNNGQAQVVGGFKSVAGSGLLSVARQFGSELRVGASFAYHLQSIHGASASGFGLDLGMQWVQRDYTLGLSLQNLGASKLTWSSGHRDTLAQQLNAGVSAWVLPDVKVLSDIGVSSARTDINAGVVWQVNDSLSLQGGVADATSSRQIRFGSQLRLDTMILNYAFSQHSALGSVQKLGVGIAL